MLMVVKIHAQQDSQSCGTDVPEIAWESAFQKLISDYKMNHPSKKESSTLYTIPIIFHVIHSGQPVGTFPNISQGQLNAQVTVLNQDFSGQGYQSNTYPNQAFINFAINQAIPAASIDSMGRIKIANAGIQFCLAAKDTNGQVLPEPGIDRINYLSLNLSPPERYASQATMKSYLDDTLKPKTIWDVTKYLNVWITDKNSALNYNGVSSVPPWSGLAGISNNATASTDGIWCFAKVIGSNNLYPNGIYGSPLVAGRTLTHEIGHYLGLRHISGDGACATDYCEDTPPSAAQNIGAPTYPYHVGSCSNPSNAPDGEMYMNFMDYPWDPYKYMFTEDQAVRMQTAMLNSPYRKQLGTHGLCDHSVGLPDIYFKDSYVLYPNPAETALHLNFSADDIIELSIVNLPGQVVMTSPYQNQIDISALSPGIYILAITTRQHKYTKKFIKE